MYNTIEEISIERDQLTQLGEKLVQIVKCYENAEKLLTEVEKESSSSSTQNETSNSWVDKVGSYLGKSINQLIKGNYTDDVTLLGTGMQVGTGILGIDVLADIRDVSADLTNWEWSWGHAGQTILDVVGIVPLMGAVKYTDEVAEHITNITNEN